MTGPSWIGWRGWPEADGGLSRLSRSWPGGRGEVVGRVVGRVAGEGDGGAGGGANCARAGGTRAVRAMRQTSRRMASPAGDLSYRMGEALPPKRKRGPRDGSRGPR